MTGKRKIQFNKAGIWAILGILVVISRVPFFEETPFEWDSVNFLYAIERFDISDDRPHPPGYIGYVYLGKAVNLIIRQPQSSLLVINIMAALLLLLGVHVLVKPYWDEKSFYFLSIILIFNPIVWFYGEVTLSYLSGAAAWVWCVWLLLRIKEGKDKRPLAAGFIWGIAGAIRPDVVIFLIPAGLYAVHFELFSSKARHLFFGFIAGILVWLIPTVILTGTSFSSALRTIFTSSTGYYSVLMGASPVKHLEMTAKAALWLFIGCGWMLPIFFRKDFYDYIRKNNSVYFLTAAVLPLMLFQMLFLLPIPGYILLYLPGIIIIGLGYLRLQRHFKTKVILIGMLSSVYFLFYPAPADPPGASYITGNYIQTAVGKLNTLAKSNIESNDYYTRIWTEGIKNGYNSDSTLILTCGRDYSWRKATYFLPEFSIIEYNIETETPIQIWREKKIFNYPAKDITLSEIKTLLILTEEQGFAKKIVSKTENLKTVITEGGVRWFEYEIDDNDHIVFKNSRKASSAQSLKYIDEKKRTNHN